MVFTHLSRLNAEIAGFLGRLVAEEDPRSTIEYTVPLGRAAHLLGLRLQRATLVLTMFSRFEDFGPEADVEGDVEGDEVDEDAMPYEATIAAGIDALRHNPHFTPELLEELFGDAGKDAVLPTPRSHLSTGGASTTGRDGVNDHVPHGHELPN